MTRDEIQELIEYLEKNYCVKCEYEAEHKGSIFNNDRLRIYPNLPLNFSGLKYSINNDKARETITNKLDLIRF